MKVVDQQVDSELEKIRTTLETARDNSKQEQLWKQTQAGVALTHLFLTGCLAWSLTPPQVASSSAFLPLLPEKFLLDHLQPASCSSRAAYALCGRMEVALPPQRLAVTFHVLGW